MPEPRKRIAQDAHVGDDLPDVNVWLALAVMQHPHHDAAAAYWKNLTGRSIWFCRITMLGLVRLLSQPKVMGEQALSLTQAMAAYHQFAALPEVGLQAEPADCGDQLQRFLSTDTPARLLTDAYLAAFAVSARMRMVTFDKDFDRFLGLDCLRLVATNH